MSFLRYKFFEIWVFPSRQLHVQTYFTPCSSVSIVNFEQVNAGCVHIHNPQKKANPQNLQNPNPQKKTRIVQAF